MATNGIPVNMTGSLTNVQNINSTSALKYAETAGRSNQVANQSKANVADRSTVQIQESMRFRVNDMTKSVDRLQNNISKMQVADQGMQITENALAKMKDIAKKATDETLTTEQRSKYNDELKKMREVIDKVVDKTKLDDKKLLDGKFNERLQTGASQNHTTNVKIGDMSSKALGVKDADVSTAEDAKQALANIEAAQKKVAAQRKQVGIVQAKMKETETIQSAVLDKLIGKDKEIRDAQSVKEQMDSFKEKLRNPIDINNMLNVNRQSAISLLIGRQA